VQRGRGYGELDLLRAMTEDQPVPEDEFDGRQVQQALTNLVVNGIQAMPSDGGLTVRVACANEATPPDVSGDPGATRS
jgi:signal transduction histidine kinase